MKRGTRLIAALGAVAACTAAVTAPLGPCLRDIRPLLLGSRCVF
jgi:hypothetical protein